MQLGISLSSCVILVSFTCSFTQWVLKELAITGHLSSFQSPSCSPLDWQLDRRYLLVTLEWKAASLCSYIDNFKLDGMEYIVGVFTFSTSLGIFLNVRHNNIVHMRYVNFPFLHVTSTCITLTVTLRGIVLLPHEINKKDQHRLMPSAT